MKIQRHPTYTLFKRLNRNLKEIEILESHIDNLNLELVSRSGQQLQSLVFINNVSDERPKTIHEIMIMT